MDEFVDRLADGPRGERGPGYDSAGRETRIRHPRCGPGGRDETNDGRASWLWRDVLVDARPGGEWLAIFPGSNSGGGHTSSPTH